MKSIFRNALGVAVAAMAVASPLYAAGDGHFLLTDKASPNDWFNRAGMFTASYNPIASPVNSAFSVFCVDRNGAIEEGYNYDAWVTEIAAGPMSNTELGGAGNPDAYEIYRRQAYLVQTYFALGGNTGLTGSENDWQWAIWGLKEGGGLSATLASFKAIMGDFQGTLAWNVIVNTGALGAAGGAFDATDWRVITDVSNDCLKAGSPAKCQELIFKSGSPPEEIVPEPATMSLLAMGLAGMAGAGIRRRNKK